MNKLLLPAIVFSALASACVQPDMSPTAPPPRDDCGSDHSLVGETATLTTRAHEVMGTLEVVDNCTLEITDFHFDGGGVDVRAIVSPNGDYTNGIVLSEDLRRSGGYDGEKLQLNLPEGVTLDDVGGLSIWCVPFGASFGDATL